MKPLDMTVIPEQTVEYSVHEDLKAKIEANREQLKELKKQLKHKYDM
jgi:hypothetical protein